MKLHEIVVYVFTSIRIGINLNLLYITPLADKGLVREEPPHLSAQLILFHSGAQPKRSNPSKNYKRLAPPQVENLNCLNNGNEEIAPHLSLRLSGSGARN